MSGTESGSERFEKVAAAFRAGARSYLAMGSPLYAALCAGGAGDEEIVVLADKAQAGSQPVFHLLASVHYLLLHDPKDPLGRYFATLVDDPAPPDEAFPEFARFCRKQRDEILRLMASRTVQTTYVERCAALMPPLSLVAEEAGEPLNLVEIGCSAGVLLTFDKYAYDLKGRGRVGPADAPLTLAADIRGGPPLRIPKIGSRTGLDLHPIDVRIEDERRWLIALSFPEYREERARLATALDVVARTDIRMFQGDALALLPKVLAETPSPLCVFHSACLYYWSAEAKAALDDLLLSASHDRDIYRVGLEASERFNAWHKGQSAVTDQPAAGQAAGEAIIARYHGGSADIRVVARNKFLGPFEWID